MDLGKNESFLLDLAYNRFQQILEEIANNEGMKGPFFGKELRPYLVNPGTLGDILAGYPDQQAKLRVGCLLRASKEVYRELEQHFAANNKRNRKVLIYEMPTDKYLRLKLQIEYNLRYTREIDDEGLTKFKEVGVLRDELLGLITQAKQLKTSREEISQQIRDEVQINEAAHFIGISQLRYEVQSQQNEINKIGDQVKASTVTHETFVNKNDMRQKRIEENLEILTNRLNSFGSESQLTDKLHQLLHDKLRISYVTNEKHEALDTSVKQLYIDIQTIRATVHRQDGTAESSNTTDAEDKEMKEAKDLARFYFDTSPFKQSDYEQADLDLKKIGRLESFRKKFEEAWQEIKKKNKGEKSDGHNS